MNLADKLCYPQDGYTNEDGVFVREKFGLTFRERLIIALASNPECFVTMHDGTGWTVEREPTAQKIIGIADAIIKKLEEQK